MDRIPDVGLDCSFTVVRFRGDDIGAGIRACIQIVSGLCRLPALLRFN